VADSEGSHGRATIAKVLQPLLNGQLQLPVPRPSADRKR